MRDAGLEAVPSASLARLRNLRSLDLSANTFAAIPGRAFAGLRSLRELRIAQCQRLTTLAPAAFHGLAQLQQLQLSFNPRLASLPAGLFKPLASLQHLGLRGNALGGLARTLLPETLLSLDLRDSQLECNCSVRWLLELQLNASIASLLDLENAQCSAPGRLRGRRLQDLAGQDLSCSAIGVSSVIAYVYYGVGAVTAALLVALLGLLVVRGVARTPSRLDAKGGTKAAAPKAANGAYFAAIDGRYSAMPPRPQSVPLDLLWRHLQLEYAAREDGLSTLGLSGLYIKSNGLCPNGGAPRSNGSTPQLHLWTAEGATLPQEAHTEDSPIYADPVALSQPLSPSSSSSASGASTHRFPTSDSGIASFRTSGFSLGVSQEGIYDNLEGRRCWDI